MKRFHSIARRIPAWLPTILAVGLLLWLTLAPKPLGDNNMVLFPGADKLVHALMFGGTAAAFLFDLQKYHSWRPLRWPTLIGIAVILSLAGVAIEFAQEALGDGRSFEETDMVADTIGAFAAAILWRAFQKHWSIKIKANGGY